MLRPVLPQNGPAQQDFIRGLSPVSRYRRFHVGLRELPEAALQRLTAVDHRDRVPLVALPALSDGDEQALMAEARHVRTGAAQAEFALAVADDRYGLGLDRQMPRQLARYGMVRLRGRVLTDIAPMLTLVRSLGGSLRTLPGEAAQLQATITL